MHTLFACHTCRGYYGRGGGGRDRELRSGPSVSPGAKVWVVGVEEGKKSWHGHVEVGRRLRERDAADLSKNQHDGSENAEASHLCDWQ